MAHFLCDRGHGQHFFLIEIREQKKLRERNVTGRKLFAEMQHKAALHLEDDVGQSLGVGTEVVGRGLGKRRFRIQSLLN